MKWLCMDIWKKLYLMAKEEYHPESVSPFIEAHHVVCALESPFGIVRLTAAAAACLAVHAENSFIS